MSMKRLLFNLVSALVWPESRRCVDEMIVVQFSGVNECQYRSG